MSKSGRVRKVRMAFVSWGVGRGVAPACLLHACPAPARSRWAASLLGSRPSAPTQLSLPARALPPAQVASFAGAKRKMSGDVCGSRASLPDSLAAAHSGHHHHSYHHLSQVGVAACFHWAVCSFQGSCLAWALVYL